MESSAFRIILEVIQLHLTCRASTGACQQPQMQPVDKLCCQHRKAGHLFAWAGNVLHCFLLQHRVCIFWVFGCLWKNRVQVFFAEVQAGLCCWLLVLKLLRKNASALTLDRIFQKELQECKRSLHALFTNKSYRPHDSPRPALAVFLSASLLPFFTSVFVSLPGVINFLF